MVRLGAIGQAIVVISLCMVSGLASACQVNAQDPVSVKEYGHSHVTDNGVTVVTVSEAIDGDSRPDGIPHRLLLRAHVERVPVLPSPGSRRGGVPALSAVRSFDGVSLVPDDHCATEADPTILRCELVESLGTPGGRPLRQHVEFQYAVTGPLMVEVLRVTVTDLTETDAAGNHPSWTIDSRREEGADLVSAWG